MNILCKKRFFFAIIFALLVPPFLYAAKNYSDTPKRIVSLTPSGTEILFALSLGEKIVARTDFCNYPDETAKIESLGGFDGKTFSIEVLLSYRPDFVYLSSGMHDYLIPTLKNFGIKYYISDVSNVEGIFDEIKSISKIFNIEDDGDVLCRQIKNELSAVCDFHNENAENREAVHEKDKTVYVEISPSPFITCGNLSYINDLIELCGGKNIFSNIAQSYPCVNEELIILQNPDVIIVFDYNNAELKRIFARKGWQFVSAMQNKKVFSVNADIFTRPSVRIVEAAKTLKALLQE